MELPCLWWGGEGIGALFCSHSGRSVLFPFLPLLRSGVTGLQVEAQPHPSILMGRGQEGEQTLTNFPGTKRSEEVLPLERLMEGTLTCLLCSPLALRLAPIGRAGVQRAS